MLDSISTFGDLLKCLRLRAQLTQRDLSIAVGYSEAQISRQENNKRIPSEHALKALFIPALGLEDDPTIVDRLLELAEKAREQDPLWTVADTENKISPHTTGQPVRNNMPRQWSSFIGREKEISQLVEMVREHPLVTVTGAGGVGKTRLALQAAKELLECFPDGIWLVELAPIIDPVFVPITLASIFNVHSAQGQRLVQTLRGYLASKRLLIILDNCEHVIDAVAQLSKDLLEGCPNINILATSREILDVEGEYFLRCPSLSLPDVSPAHASTQVLETVESSEAVRLFVDRAAAASPGFRLTEKNAAVTAEICQRLDGIPLAIELAAARLRLLSLDEVAIYMNDVFHLLSGSRRVVLPRHKTLKALIDWSYQILSPAEQILLRRLSVFVGGWTLQAAKSVAGSDGIESDEVLDRMQQLADKSLIFVEPTEFGKNRFRMLETIRQYSAEKIQEAGEYDRLRDRHLAFFVRMAEKGSSADSNPSLNFQWAQGLMRELDNIRLALAWSLETNIELGLRLGVSFWKAVPFNLLLELGNWLDRLLEAEETEHNKLGFQLNDVQSLLLRGEALLRVGESRYLWGMRNQSERALLQSLAILEGIGEPAHYLRACGQMELGTLLICTDPEQSRLYLESSRDTMIRMGERSSLPDFDRKLVALNLYTGDLDCAAQFAEEDVQICTENNWSLTAALEWSGKVAFFKGDFDRAIRFYQKAQEEGYKNRNFPMASYQVFEEGSVALAQGNEAHVLHLSEDMLFHGRETGDASWFFHTETLLALLEWMQGANDQAERRCEEGVSKYYAEFLGFTIPFVYVLGRLSLAKGDLNNAARFFRQMDDMATAPRLKWKAYSLHAFGLLVAEQSRQEPKMAERAALLFGAQEKLFAWLPNILSPFEKSEYERTQTMVKEILGEEAFATIWVKGQGMSHQQAFALALEDTEENLV